MKKIVKSAILVFIMLLLSKILALFKEVLIAEKFATSYIVDAYTVVISLPTIVFTVFASGFSSSYLPLFMRLKENEKNRFFNNIFNILLVFSIVILIICFIFNRTIIFLLAPGFDKKTIEIAIKFIKIIVFYFPFYVLFSMLSAHLQAKEKFILSSFCNYILTNIILIISIFLSSYKKTNILLYGYVVSGFLSFFILYITLIYRKEIKYVFLIDFKDENFKQFCKIAIPFGLSSIINQCNAMIDKIFSSSLGEGAVSYLNYANKVQLLPYSLIISITLAILSPKINKAVAENDNENYLFYVSTVIMFSCYISLPILIILFTLSEPIIKFLFERGKFNIDSTLIVAKCLSYYSLGIPFYALREILNIVFVANYKQDIILKNTIISIVLNIVFNLIFIKIFGYGGLALSTSLSGIISYLIMNHNLKKLGLNSFYKYQFSKEILKMLVSAIIIGIINIFFYKYLCAFINFNISFIIILCINILVYLIFTYLLKVKILIYVFEEIKKIKY